jgi:hypothetical protein
MGTAHESDAPGRRCENYDELEHHATVSMIAVCIVVSHQSCHSRFTPIINTHC